MSASSSSVAKSYIQKENGVWDLKDKLKDGNYTVVIDNVEFHFFVKIGTNNKLIVSHTGGAGGEKRDNGHFYSRWSFFSKTDSTVLCIDDPMVWQYGVHHGWFYGTHDKSYAQLSAILIKKVCDVLDIGYSDILLYSSSSGGTAAIVCSRFIGCNCKVMAINPQIIISNDPHSKTVSIKTGLDFNQEDPLDRNDMSKIITAEKNVQYFLAFNRKSEWDIKLNYSPLCEKCGIKSNDRIIKKKNITLITYSAVSEAPHGAQDWITLFPFLEYICRNSEVINKMNDHILNSILDLWSEHYLAETEKKYLKYFYTINPAYYTLDDLEKMSEIFNEQGFKGFKELMGNIGDYSFGSESISISKELETLELKIIDSLCATNKRSDYLEAYYRCKKITNNTSALGKLGRITRILNLDGKYTESIKWFKSASDKDKRWLKEYIDTLILTNDEEHLKKAFELCSEHIVENSPIYYGRMGRMYRDGKGTPVDLDIAIIYLKKAYELDNAWIDDLAIALVKDGKYCGELKQLYKTGQIKNKTVIEKIEKILAE